MGEITEIGGYFSGKDLCLSHEANLLARNVWLRDYMNMDIVHKFDTFAEFSVTEKEIVICLLLWFSVSLNLILCIFAMWKKNQALMGVVHMCNVLKATN